jgi:hypothetical protein
MKRIRLKRSRLEKRPNMKGSKDKEKIERLQRRSRAPNTQKEHGKRIKSTKCAWKTCKED